MISLMFIPGMPFIYSVVIYCIFFLYLSMVAGDVQNPNTNRSLFMIPFLKYKIPLLHENEIQSSVETKWFDEYINQ